MVEDEEDDGGIVFEVRMNKLHRRESNDETNGHPFTFSNEHEVTSDIHNITSVSDTMFTNTSSGYVDSPDIVTDTAKLPNNIADFEFRYPFKGRFNGKTFLYWV